MPGIRRFNQQLRTETLGVIYNISASNCFVDTVAERFLAEYRDNPLALAEVLFLLPNRRACKAMADAFVKAQGMQPTLLPQMTPIGDVEEDELLLSGEGAEEALFGLPPAIERSERLMLFTKIIMAKPSDFGLEKMSLNQACFLAQELARLIDTVHNENLDFSNLAQLVPEEYAAHWQETLKFLEIITRYWPEILKERGLSDPSFRRNELIRRQCHIWREHPPAKRIVAAGTTATFPAMKELAATVLALPKGELIINGLDRELDADSWAAIDETHPQFELKELLDYLELKREDVADFEPVRNIEREKLISEVMRPAKTTDKWRNLAAEGIKSEALHGITAVNCNDIREEALAIALIMRQTLEIPEKTAALVTPDRNLARRVASELERWDIKVDDSAGRPLTLTPVGTFLRLVAKTAVRECRRIDFLSLLKHPLTGLGQSYAETRMLTRQLEQKVWRGGKADEALEAFAAKLCELQGDFSELCSGEKADLKDLIRSHIKAAERIASLSDKDGGQILWRGDDGEAAANFIADWYEKAEVLGEIDVKEYLGLWEAMAAGVMVRPKFGMHPRLRILGPIEARLTHFDTIIAGEVNEGVWPQAAASDPWMSRPMKKDFGFPLPEKAIGVSGLDFSLLMGAEEVFLTRAERVQGTPMVKSRWWMRLETVLKALNLSINDFSDVVYRLSAKNFDKPERFEKVNAPAPCPPVNARPRELSASAIELLMRDPYSVFAKYILRLKPLDDVETDLTMADYGTIIHAILEKFNNKYNEALPPGALEKLLEIGKESFAENNLALERRAFWWPNFEKIAEHLVKVEEEYRQEVRKVHNEVKGKFSFNAPAGVFTVTAKADRVDETKDGRINIIDYKTGKIRTPKEVAKGFAPQLPIEGLIAEKGGFGTLPAAEVAKLIYWQLGRRETVIEENMEDILATTEDHLHKLISVFDFETTPYICHPNPKRIPEYSDYEQLARVKEWSVAEEE